MDGFCSLHKLDLTLFYKIEGCFDNLKSLMTLMTVTLMTGFMNTCTHIHHGEFARVYPFNDAVIGSGKRWICCSDYRSGW